MYNVCCEIRAHREQDADKIADKRATEIVAKAISKPTTFIAIFRQNLSIRHNLLIINFLF